MTAERPEVPLALFGLQRSGTNHLESTLTRHFRVRFVNDRRDRTAPGHKHFRLYDAAHLVPAPEFATELAFSDLGSFEARLPERPRGIVVISKHPVSWLVSYRAWAERCGWPSVDHHYIEEWNHFYARWLAFSRESPRVRLVRYADLLSRRRAVLRELGAGLDLARLPLWRRVRPPWRREAQSARFTRSKRRYYLEEGYLDEVPAEERALIRHLVDPEVVGGLGYGVPYRSAGLDADGGGSA